MLNNRLEPYFPTAFRWLGAIIIPFSIMALITASGFISGLLAISCLLAGVAFIWTFHGIRVDPENNRFKNYVGVFGLESGSWMAFPALEKIFLTETKYSQVVWSRVASTKHRTRSFKAFFKGSDNFKLLFSSKTAKNKVFREAAETAEKLNLPLQDCTTKPPKWIQ